MKRNGPMVTLLAGIAVAAVFFALSMIATRTGRIAEPPPDPLPVAAAPSEEAPAPESPIPEAPVSEAPARTPPLNREPLAASSQIKATWAGSLKPGTLALSAKNGTAIAYLCDGKRVEAWLKGTAADGRLKLSGAKGASLTGTFDSSRARGTIKIGSRTYEFSVAAVKKPSGLYRAVRNVRGAKLVGGWIVLADGRQVGLGNVNGQVRETSGLDLATSTATIDGITVTAAPAEGAGE